MIYGAFRLKFPAGRQAPFRSLPSYAAVVSFWLKKPTGKKNLFSYVRLPLPENFLHYNITALPSAKEYRQVSFTCRPVACSRAVR